MPRYALPEIEYAGLLWTYLTGKASIDKILSLLPGYDPNTLLLLTLARGLDVSTWMTKWIDSLSKGDTDRTGALENLKFYWTKIHLLKSAL